MYSVVTWYTGEQGHSIQFYDVKLRHSKSTKEGCFRMPWESRTVYRQTEEFVQAAIECSNFSRLCREFSITRRTGYKMKSELLKHRTIADIEDADRQLQIWREKYNNVRPHETLGMKCPGEVYNPSSRAYPEKVFKYDYGGQYHVIKVNSWGYVRFDKWQTYLSETMIGQYIEFRPGSDGETFIACYRNYKIAEFDTSTGQLLNRTIARL